MKSYQEMSREELLKRKRSAGGGVQKIPEPGLKLDMSKRQAVAGAA